MFEQLADTLSRHDVDDETGFDLLVGPASVRQALGNRSGNLERLTESLLALSRGQSTVEEAVAQVDGILMKFRRWWRDLASCQDDAFLNDEEVRMHADYLAICGHLLDGLQGYRASLLAGGSTSAGTLMLALEEGFDRLQVLKDHYASLGY